VLLLAVWASDAKEQSMAFERP